MECNEGRRPLRIARVSNKPGRLKSALCDVRELETGPPFRQSVAASLQGRLRYMGTNCWGRSGAVPLRLLGSISRRALPLATASGEARRVRKEVRRMVRERRARKLNLRRGALRPQDGTCQASTLDGRQ